MSKRFITPSADRLARRTSGRGPNRINYGALTPHTRYIHKWYKQSTQLGAMNIALWIKSQHINDSSARTPPEQNSLAGMIDAGQASEWVVLCDMIANEDGEVHIVIAPIPHYYTHIKRAEKRAAVVTDDAADDADAAMAAALDAVSELPKPGRGRKKRRLPEHELLAAEIARFENAESANDTTANDADGERNDNGDGDGEAEYRVSFESADAAADTAMDDATDDPEESPTDGDIDRNGDNDDDLDDDGRNMTDEDAPNGDGDIDLDADGEG